MARCLAAACSILIGLLPLSLAALGLGEIDPKSALNQPFVAEIPVSSESASELTGLEVSLASRDTFSKYGLDRPEFLSDFAFQVVTGNAGPVVLITSRQPVTEPFVTLLVEITWRQGRLLREYTVLLDPPVFASSAAEPVAPPPVAAPTQRPEPPPVVRTAEPEAPPVAQRPAAPVPPAEPDRRAPPPAPPARPATQPDVDIYPVQKNDTLWAIAGRVQPAGSTANRNQVMVAIYRENPEAFAGNINRLKAGTILRIPDAEQIDRTARQDAFSEVRRQNDEWRGGGETATESARLRLVPPPEPQESTDQAPEADLAPSPTPSAVDDAVAAAEREDLQRSVSELESELSDSQRLLALRDEELKALQDQLASMEQRLEAATAEVAPEEAELPDEPSIEPTPLPVDPAELPPPTVEPEVVEQQPPSVTEVVTTAQEPSLIGALFTNIWFYISLFVVLVLALFVSRRNRQAESPVPGRSALDSEEAEAEFDEEFENTASLQAPRIEDEAFVVEEGPADGPTDDDVAKTLTVKQLEAERSIEEEDDEERELPFERTISTDSGVNLDQADPIAEADFHMAYGLYDQAANLLTNALNADPDSRPLRLKLLEVFFIWENKDGFLKEARVLQERISDESDPEWNKVLIMGKQICPDDDLFSAAPGAVGVAEEMDLALTEDGGGDLDMTLAESPEEGLDLDFGESSDELDLDLGDDADSSETASLDLGLGDFTAETQGGSTTAETPTLEAEAVESTLETPTIESEAVESTLETPTIESEAVASTLETPTIETPAGDWDDDRAVDHDDAAVGEADQTAEIELDDLGLDLSGLDEAADDILTGHQEVIDEPLADDAEATMAADLDDDEIGKDEDAEALESTAEFDVRGDDFSGDDDADDLVNVESTAEMQALNIDAPPAGDTVEQPAIGDVGEADEFLSDPEVDPLSETGFSEGVLSGLGDLDEDLALADEEESRDEAGEEDPTAAMKIPEDMGLDSDERDSPTMTEVGTKLDLARAYIDMGDPDGARSILNEVLEEAGEAQRQEAQKLLDDLDD